MSKGKGSPKKSKKPSKKEIHVDGHTRTLKDGRRVRVRPHYRDKPS